MKEKKNKNKKRQQPDSSAVDQSSDGHFGIRSVTMNIDKTNLKIK